MYIMCHKTIVEERTTMKRNRIAILWRGDREARRAATPQNNRFHRIF
jgi:hypothetical protein